MRVIIDRILRFVLITAVISGGCAIYSSRERSADQTISPVLKMTAFRTGGRFGDAVDEATKRKGDPIDYLVLVNDDDEEQAGSGVPDNSNDRLLLPPSGDADDDIGRIRLEPPSLPLRDGVLILELSNPSAVRIFRADGKVLRDLSVECNRPKGDLAALVSAPVDLWYEVLKPDSRFTFRYIYRARDGRIHGDDSVHACFAKWTVIGRDGNPMLSRMYIEKTLLLNIARGLVPRDQADEAIDNAAYRIRIEGLPSRAMRTLTVKSNDVPGEKVELDALPSEERTDSKQFVIGYDSHKLPAEPLTDDERHLVVQNLGLMPIHESP